MPLDVLELSMFKVDVLSNDMLEPSTTNVPSISVLSKLVVPSTSMSPLTSRLVASISPLVLNITLSPPSTSKII